METIFDQLQLVNEQLIKFEQLKQLFAGLLADPQFKGSDLYLDLRLKYLTQIENIINTRPMATSTAPNIYQHPSQTRKSFSRKRPQTDRKLKTSSDSKQDDAKQYISFDHENVTYYIHTTGSMEEGHMKYSIHRQSGQQVGYLKGPEISLGDTVKIRLDSVSPLQLEGPCDRLLSSYCLV